MGALRGRGTRGAEGVEGAGSSRKGLLTRLLVLPLVPLGQQGKEGVSGAFPASCSQICIGGLCPLLGVPASPTWVVVPSASLQSRDFSEKPHCPPSSFLHVNVQSGFVCSFTFSPGELGVCVLTLQCPGHRSLQQLLPLNMKKILLKTLLLPLVVWA